MSSESKLFYNQPYANFPKVITMDLSIKLFLLKSEKEQLFKMVLVWL